MSVNGLGLISITDEEFNQFSDLIYRLAGISLGDAKKPLIVSRLAKRLRHYGLDSFSDYYRFVKSDISLKEMQMVIDLLTTNETYFFREPKHFESLKEHAKNVHKKGDVFRVWSAASSSGEEAYTLAMELCETLGPSGWEILGTDISQRVIESATTGVYTLDRCRFVPREYLTKYLLKGVRTQIGTLRVKKHLRDRVTFRRLNLLDDLPALSQFDAIFLRNIMIYFDFETKVALVNKLVDKLKRGGYFFVGHSESLNGITDRLCVVKPSIYQRPMADSVWRKQA